MRARALAYRPFQVGSLTALLTALPLVVALALAPMDALARDVKKEATSSKTPKVKALKAKLALSKKEKTKAKAKEKVKAEKAASKSRDA